MKKGMLPMIPKAREERLADDFSDGGTVSGRTLSKAREERPKNAFQGARLMSGGLFLRCLSPYCKVADSYFCARKRLGGPTLPKHELFGGDYSKNQVETTRNVRWGRLDTSGRHHLGMIPRLIDL